MEVKYEDKKEFIWRKKSMQCDDERNTIHWQQELNFNQALWVMTDVKNLILLWFIFVPVRADVLGWGILTKRTMHRSGKGKNKTLKFKKTNKNISCDKTWCLLEDPTKQGHGNNWWLYFISNTWPVRHYFSKIIRKGHLFIRKLHIKTYTLVCDWAFSEKEVNY